MGAHPRSGTTRGGELGTKQTVTLRVPHYTEEQLAGRTVIG